MVRAVSTLMCVGALAYGGMWVWNATDGDPTPANLYRLSQSHVDDANDVSERLSEMARDRLDLDSPERGRKKSPN